LILTASRGAGRQRIRRDNCPPKLAPGRVCQIAPGWPRPPAARISFLLPRTSRGKARPPHCLLRPALGPATQRGSHATGALYSFVCHASPRSRRTRRARQAAAASVGARRRRQGPVAGSKPSPYQIGPLQHNVHRRRSTKQCREASGFGDLCASGDELG